MSLLCSIRTAFIMLFFEEFFFVVEMPFLSARIVVYPK